MNAPVFCGPAPYTRVNYGSFAECEFSRPPIHAKPASGYNAAPDPVWKTSGTAK